ncbi:hypothetical protein D3C71_2010120 [compost metagenome]
MGTAGIGTAGIGRVGIDAAMRRFTHFVFQVVIVVGLVFRQRVFGLHGAAYRITPPQDRRRNRGRGHG